MYFTLNPQFYYMIYKSNIERYITLETNGENICTLDHDRLYSIVSKYVLENSSGIDERKLDSYIEYITKHIRSRLQRKRLILKSYQLMMRLLPCYRYIWLHSFIRMMITELQHHIEMSLR